MCVRVFSCCLSFYNISKDTDAVTNDEKQHVTLAERQRTHRTRTMICRSPHVRSRTRAGRLFNRYVSVNIAMMFVARCVTPVNPQRSLLVVHECLACYKRRTAVFRFLVRHSTPIQSFAFNMADRWYQQSFASTTIDEHLCSSHRPCSTRKQPDREPVLSLAMNQCESEVRLSHCLSVCLSVLRERRRAVLSAWCTYERFIGALRKRERERLAVPVKIAGRL
jgi:hypothetical protein